VVRTDYPFLDVKWQPVSFSLLAFRWDIVSNYAPGLSIQGGTHTTRTPLLSVPGCLFIKCRHLQRPKPEACAPLALSFLPGHQLPHWLPGRVVLARMQTVVWALIALDIEPILVSVFDRISKRGYSFRIACIRCQIAVYRQPLDRCPAELLPTPCGQPPPPVPPTLLSSPFFPQPFFSGNPPFP